VAWLSLLFAFFGSGPLTAQDSTEFGQMPHAPSAPWFDAQTQQAKPISFGARPAIRSGDRNSIPAFVPRTPNNARLGGPGLAAGSSDFSFLFWMVLALVLVSILGLMVWAFFKLEATSQQSMQTSVRRSLAESIEQLPFQLDDKTGDFRSLAEKAYQSGDYRRATIYLYSHVLVVLDQAGLIRLRKGKTNRQYFRDLDQQPGLSPYFQQAMDSFESVFFGDHEISRERFETYWTQLPGFLAAVDRELSSAQEVALAR
jgi:hypothetical protein